MKKSLFILFCFLLISKVFLFAKDDGKGFTVIEDQAKLPIFTPDLANRESLKIRLDNGLEAYLISDPDAEKSSTALVVKTGSWEDPKEYPGIAHFLEHMLFLGTKKYPDESEYDRFITEHGGMANAFTGDGITGYLLVINPNAFPEALDRFSRFFKEPLFNPSGVDRELQAINQEYAKNLEDDHCRQLFVRKELANPDHPFHAFNMGNKASLSRVSQETLQKWYREHYSANQMRLIVISPSPIKQMTEEVITAFKDIPNIDKAPLKLDMRTSSPDLHRQMTYIEPIKDLRTLSVYWELPAKFAMMIATKPDAIVSHVLGHEGQQSLLAQLKREKLADGLMTGSSKPADDVMYFYVNVELTNEGILNKDKVIERIFQAIKGMKERGIPHYIFDEIRQMSIIDYQYQAKEDAFGNIMDHAMSIASEDIATYPENTQIIQKYDANATKELINYLTPQNAFFDLLAPSSLTGIKPDRKEQWLGVSYAVKAIPQSTIAKWTLTPSHSQIDSPPPNPLIPRKLELLNTAVSKKLELPRPTTIVDNEFGKIYFSNDNRFGIPKILWTFEIKTPAITEGDASSLVLGDLYVRAVYEALKQETYLAELAGLHFSIARSENGIDLSIEGYSENASILFEKVLRSLKELKPQESQFKTHKDHLQRQYENATLDSPLRQALELLKTVWYKHHTASKQKAAAIKKISFEKFSQFSKQIFNKIYVQGLFYGNMSEEQGRELSDTFLSLFADSSEPYSKAEQQKREVVVLSNEEGPYYLEANSKSQGSAVILAIEDIPYSFKARAAQQILMRAMKEPFFSALRTKQQTCYLVSTSAEDVEQHLFNCFMIQSSSHDVRDLLARFELVIEGFLQEMTKTELPPERFESIKHSLLSILEQPPKNLNEMGELLSSLAFKYEGDFDWMSKRIQGFKELTYSEFVTLSSQWISKDNKRRLAVLLKGSQDEKIMEYKKISVPQLRKLTSYEGDTPMRDEKAGNSIAVQ